MSVNCASGCAEPSSVLVLPLAFQLSPNEADRRVEVPFLDDLALVHARPPHDHEQVAIVGRRPQDVLQPGFQLFGIQVFTHLETLWLG